MRKFWKIRVRLSILGRIAFDCLGHLLWQPLFCLCVESTGLVGIEFQMKSNLLKFILIDTSKAVSLAGEAIAVPTVWIRFLFLVELVVRLLVLVTWGYLRLQRRAASLQYSMRLGESCIRTIVSSRSKFRVFGGSWHDGYRLSHEVANCQHLWQSRLIASKSDRRASALW